MRKKLFFLYSSVTSMTFFQCTYLVIYCRNLSFSDKTSEEKKGEDKI